jgi:hypothetical protein
MRHSPLLQTKSERSTNIQWRFLPHFVQIEEIKKWEAKTRVI